MRHRAYRTLLIALAAGVLALASGCVGTNARVEPYRMRQSEIQELKTDYGDCCISHGATQAGGETEEVRFTLTSERDVDAAYARLKRAFGFRGDNRASAADTTTQAPRPETDHGRAASGGGYSMRARRTVGGHPGMLQIDIERNEHGGSRLLVAYEAGGEGRFPAGEGFRRLLAAKIREALR